MGKKPQVNLRVFKGSKMSYDENGKPQNENQRVTLPYDTVQWQNYLKALRANRFVRVDVENVFFVESKKDDDGFFKDTFTDAGDDWMEKVKEEVKKHYEDAKPELTPEQKKIAELEAAIKALQNGSTKVKESKSEKKKEISEDINELRAKYEKLYDKKPFAGWKADKLIEKINEKS